MHQERVEQQQLDFALVPANVTDGALAEQSLIGQRDLTVLGDKAYINAALQTFLASRNNLHLLTPPAPISTSPATRTWPPCSPTSARPLRP